MGREYCGASFFQYSSFHQKSLETALKSNSQITLLEYRFPPFSTANIIVHVHNSRTQILQPNNFFLHLTYSPQSSAVTNHKSILAKHSTENSFKKLNSTASPLSHLFAVILTVSPSQIGGKIGQNCVLAYCSIQRQYKRKFN